MRERMRYATSMVSLALACGLAAAGRVQAQTPHGAHEERRCATLDTTEAWYATQRAWWDQGESAGWTDDALRAVLIETATRIERTPAEFRFALQLGSSKAPFPRPPEKGPLQVSDTAGIGAVRARLLLMAENDAWPTRSLVGAAGTRAAWLIARDDSTLAAAALQPMKSARAGEVLQADVAVLEDIIRQQRGESQKYGSRWQYIYHDNMHGTNTLLNPPADMVNGNVQRSKVGLPPFGPATCIALGMKTP